MERRNPRVTIGVPVFNGERYLERALRSLCDQDFGDLEILVADNASTDGSLAIAERWAATDARVRILTSAENRGAAWNFNRLVDSAGGELFMWAASDDEFDRRYVGALAAALDRDDDAVLAHGDTVDIDESGSVIHTWDLAPQATDGPAANRFGDVMRDTHKCFAVFGLIRTDVLRRTTRIGPYSGSDKVLLAELALHGRFVHVPEPLFRHREHADRSMNRHPDERTRPVWFDTTRAGRISLPYWRTFAEYTRVVARTSLDASNRFRSIVHLGWYAKRWHRALASDARFGLSHLSGQVLGRLGPLVTRR